MIREILHSQTKVWWLQEAVKYACVPVLVGTWLLILGGK